MALVVAIEGCAFGTENSIESQEVATATPAPAPILGGTNGSGPADQCGKTQVAVKLPDGSFVLLDVPDACDRDETDRGDPPDTGAAKTIEVSQPGI